MNRRLLWIGGAAALTILALVFSLTFRKNRLEPEQDTPSPTVWAEDIPFPPITETPKSSPAPTPTPSATPLFIPGRSSNLIINEELDKSITPTSYPIGKDSLILIYHTHGEEAYRQEGQYRYEETEKESFKTLEKDKSIIAIGRLLQKMLTERGYLVVHDETDCEPPDIYSAYSRSLEVMEQYPETVVYLDLHRNAANVRLRQDDVVLLEHKRVARMFFVVGTGIGTYEGEYDIAPDWEKNYRVARSMEAALNAFEPTLCSPILLKVGRHNQHLEGYSMLLELGHNANSFEEAQNALPYIVSAIEQVFPLEP